MDNFTKQLMVKIADGSFQGTLMPPGSDLSDPSGLGRNLGRDIQQFPGYTPGTRQFNEYIQQNQFSPEYGQGLYTMQQRMLGLAQSPQAVQSFAQGQIPDMSSIYGDIGEAQFPSTGVMDSAGRLLAGASQYVPSWALPAWASPTAIDAAKARVRQGVQQGVMGSLDRNSPFVQRMMANAGTTYLSNKIDDWSRSLGGSWGHQLGGLGQFLLGLGSRIPGYETLMNKGIDFFGPQNLNQYFPATAGYQQQQPKQIAGPANPTPPQQPAAPTAPTATGPTPPQQSTVKRNSAPYTHYHVVYQSKGFEVLSPWNHR